MQKLDDKQAFAARLRQALKRSPKKIETAADLAVQFSLRHSATAITTQSAHKWLTGKSRPTADKLKTLATWLNVSPTWLLYGTADRPRAPAPLREPQPTIPTAEELRMIEKIRSLPESRRQLVQEIIEICQLDTEVWRDK
ncbi:transcriptional regulator [Candidimonas nitroreducens]|uniref:Transcriptional regulator n=1 Tax=Candidimonas nitroreducens TaxID=683354 RepID=A0A225M7X6_9BURK|nr:transcriptional regulator [Candidimonas nitroreducens]OWT55661.1 transcriptional regulator [Candidimonas nitroreducens]